MPQDPYLSKPLESKNFVTYVPVERLGFGGMGEVYKAKVEELPEGMENFPVKLGDYVAIKFIRTSVSSQATQEMLLGTLRSPHIVHTFDCGESDFFVFFVMAFIKGGTLKDYLSQQKRDKSFVEELTMLNGFISAVTFLHEKGVIHRDLKPANVLLDEEKEHSFLTDFGCARKSRSAKKTKRITKVAKHLDTVATTDISGTQYYMAPEQLIGRSQQDLPTDVYAMGLVLYEVLAGVHPFFSQFKSDETEKLDRLQKLQERGKYRRLYKVRKDVSKRFSQWIDCMLSYDPRKRPTMKAFSERCVQRILAGKKPKSPYHHPVLWGLLILMVLFVSVVVYLYLKQPATFWQLVETVKPWVIWSLEKGKEVFNFFLKFFKK